MADSRDSAAPGRTVGLIGVAAAGAGGALTAALPLVVTALLETGDRQRMLLLAAALALAAVFTALGMLITNSLAERDAGDRRARSVSSAIQLPPPAQQVLRQQLHSILIATPPASSRDGRAPALLAAAAAAAVTALGGLGAVSYGAAMGGAAVLLAAAAVTVALPTGRRAIESSTAVLAERLAASMAPSPWALGDPGLAAELRPALEQRVRRGISAQAAQARLLIALGLIASAGIGLLLTALVPLRPAAAAVTVAGEVVILASSGYLTGRAALLRRRSPVVDGIRLRTSAPPSEPRRQLTGPQFRRLSGGVSFREVTVQVGVDQPVLAGVSFDIAPGERVGLLVPPGPAPVVIAGLVARLFPPDSGSVLIDGTETRALEPAAVWSQVALVSPHPTLVPGSVLDNLLTATSEDIDESRVRSAAEASGLDDVVAQLPAGYQTMIADHWWQPEELVQLATARALLTDSALVVLYNVPTRPTPAHMALTGRTILVASSVAADLAGTDLIVVIAEGRRTRTTTYTELTLDDVGPR